MTTARREHKAARLASQRAIDERQQAQADILTLISGDDDALTKPVEIEGSDSDSEEDREPSPGFGDVLWQQKILPEQELLEVKRQKRH